MMTPYLIGAWTIGNISSDYRSFWTDDEEEMTRIDSIREAWPLFIGGLFSWYYMFVMTTCLFIMSLERTFASYFIGNYENTSRLYLLFLLFMFQHFIIFSMLYLTFCNRIHFLTAVIFFMIVNILAMIIFFGNRQYNRNIQKKFKKEHVESVRHYTLPVRFQAKENLRVFNLTVRVFVSGFVLISLAISFLVVLTFKWIPSFDTVLTYCFENIVHLNPLVMCSVLIFSVGTWSKALFHSRLPMINKLTRITFIDLRPELPNQTQQQETETYFSQLHNVWEQNRSS
uniref:Serpentine Receptor, class E (Epsilon) n=1 Tax=Caenorhabditis tropicalis TaxID=1561998 RepID=A0A1I7UK69_9PELO